MKATDRNGAEVVLGSRVRIVALSGGWLDALPPDEHERVLSMIGEVFEIDEFDDDGQPWVTKTWPEGEGRVRSHSLALAPAEMELVPCAPAPA